MEELFRTNIFNQVYTYLFYQFSEGLKKKHKMQYYKFSLKNGKIISGRAILPEIKVDLVETERRAFEFMRLEFPEIKYYNNSLIKEMFLDVYNDIFESILREDLESATEIEIDKLVDEVLKNKIK